MYRSLLIFGFFELNHKGVGPPDFFCEGSGSRVVWVEFGVLELRVLGFRGVGFFLC